MSAIIFHKVNALPLAPDANAIYFVLNGDYAETYVTDELGNAKGVGNSLMITALSPANADVKNEIPSGAINGSNVFFTSAFNFNISSLEVFLNGVKQKVLDDYNTIGNNTIQMMVSPLVTETITINYKKL